MTTNKVDLLKKENLKTKWDLYSLFKLKPDKTLLAKMHKQYQIKLNTLIKKYKNTEFTKVNEVLALLQDLEEFDKRYASGSQAEVYLWLEYQINSDNNKIVQLYKEYEGKDLDKVAELQNILNKLAKVPENVQNTLLNAPELKKYHYFLQVLFMKGKHSLPLKVEKILTLLSQPLYNNWSQLSSGYLANKKICVDLRKFKELEKFIGLKPKRQKLSFNLLRTKTRGTLKIWKFVDYIDKKLCNAQQEIAYFSSNELNSIIQRQTILAKQRKYKNTLAIRALNDEIQENTILTMTKTVTSNFSLSQKFYSYLNEQLNNSYNATLHYGLRGLRPEYNKKQEKIELETAANFIYKTLNKLNKFSASFFAGMLKQGQIDVYPKQGKRGGAFSVGLSQKLPIFIMLNWSNNISDISTLAHEFGHSLHHKLVFDNQPPVYQGYSLAIAEFASTFLETLIFYEYTKTHKQNTKYAVFMQVDDAISAVFRQVALFNFELDLHEYIAKNGYANIEIINNLFAKHMKAYLGKDVKFLQRHKYCWVAWHHIRRPFYVYTYASGLLAALNLFAEYKNAKTLNEQKQVFNKYLTILKLGSSRPVEKIFSTIGLDITKPRFWQRAIGIISQNINYLLEN